MNQLSTPNASPTPGNPILDAEKLYAGFFAIAPEVAERSRHIIEPLAAKLIANSYGTLELPATGENMVKWLQVLPHSQPQRQHERFVTQMNSLVTSTSADSRTELEKVADVFEAMLDKKGHPPAYSQKWSRIVIKEETKTIWDAICACPLILL